MKFISQYLIIPQTIRSISLPVLFAVLCAFETSAQRNAIQFMRPYDKSGIHVFETSKEDSIAYDGLRVRIGGNFTQSFQVLDHENAAMPVIEEDVDINQLTSLVNGFNLAMANLNIDAQLSNGIRLNLTMYLSSRHHEETWVKGGYIQFDKLFLFNSPAIERLMEHVTIKLGDYHPDYGDQHYRRSDGGNTTFNPFVENYIVDAFTTEIGGEVYYHTNTGFFAMAGLTNGQLNPTVKASTQIDSMTGELNTYSPAFHGKLGFDRQINQDFRARLSASLYTLKSTSNNTLYFGDRAGSQYFYLLENTLATSDGDAWSGRLNPRFNDQVTAFMINPFVKYKGVELFGTYESANGRMVTEREKRSMTQYALELIWRFPRSQNFWIGGRLNEVQAELPRFSEEISIRRICGSAGWFITRNISLKAEYINQQYEDFPEDDIRFDGAFDGFMIQAAVGF